MPVGRDEKVAEIRFPSHADQLQGVRHAVRAAVRHRGCSAALVDGMVLAVCEACMNVIQHAYGEQRPGEIVLEIYETPGEFVFRVIDFAAAVDKRRVRSRELDDVRPGGIGVHLIHEIMDRVEFLECPPGVGNILEMRKRIQSP